MDVEGKSAQGVLEAPDEIVSAQDDASGPHPMDNQGNGFLNLLGVDVVVEELLQYLDVEDLLDLSSVSKDALIAVRKSKVFSKRVQFRISNESICSRVLDNCFHSWKTVVFESCELDEELVENIPGSSTISQSLDSLESFVVDLDFRKDEKASVRSQIIEFVQKIVECSKETLKELELYLLFSDIDRIESIKCPNLKRFILCVSKSTDDQFIEAYVKNLPPLEELSVRDIRSSHLITGVQGRMFKLRKLDIGIRDVSHDDSIPPPITDWSVFEGMTKLENIELYAGRSKRAAQDIEEILGFIPAEKMKKVTVDGTILRGEGYFGPKLGEHISRFNNLTELNLLCDLKNLDDDSLQSVIKGCPKLINLTLIGLEKVTDFGFSGIKKTPTGNAVLFPSDERGAALTDLKDLTEVFISYHGIISLATLLEVIRFEFLTSLDFSVTVPSWQTVTPRQFLLQILQQNPSLSKIDLRIRSRDGDGFLQLDNSLEDEVKTVFPRIQELKFKYDPDYSDDEVSDSDDDNRVSD